MLRPVCLNCKKSFLKKNEEWDLGTGPPYCSDTCRFPPCAREGCQEARPTTNPHRTRYDKLEEWFCKKHRCTDDMKECSQCNESKPLADFDKYPCPRPNYFSLCRACLRPLCFKCKKSFLKKKEVWDYGIGPPYCSDKCRFPPCARKGCREARPTTHPYRTRYDIIAEWFCRKHK